MGFKEGSSYVRSSLLGSLEEEHRHGGRGAAAWGHGGGPRGDLPAPARSWTSGLQAARAPVTAPQPTNTLVASFTTLTVPSASSHDALIKVTD